MLTKIKKGNIFKINIIKRHFYENESVGILNFYDCKKDCHSYGGHVYKHYYEVTDNLIETDSNDNKHVIAMALAVKRNVPAGVPFLKCSFKNQHIDLCTNILIMLKDMSLYVMTVHNKSKDNVYASKIIDILA